MTTHTTREVLTVATRLADLMDERGVKYSSIAGMAGSCTTQIQVQFEEEFAALGPVAVADLLGLSVLGGDLYPASDARGISFAVVRSVFESIPVDLFGDLLTAPDDDAPVGEVPALAGVTL